MINLLLSGFWGQVSDIVFKEKNLSTEKGKEAAII